MVDAFRKQLDALMGANRNGDAEEVSRKYYERDVCRPYLCGLCPHDLFQLTKDDLGTCPKIHQLALRKEYEEARAKGVDTYERDLEDVLDKLIVECDRRITRSLKRLESDEGAAAGAISVRACCNTPESKEMNLKILTKTREAEEAELENKMEEKFKLLEELERMRQFRADLQAGYLLDAFSKDRMAAPPPPEKGGAAPHPLGFPGTKIVREPDAKTQTLIKEKLKRAEELGEEGKVDESQKLMEEAEALRKAGARPDTLLPLPGANIQIADQKLRVCDICGAFLSIFDRRSQLADHLGGKLHMGHALLRDTLDDLREARRNKKPAEVKEPPARVEDPERSRERDRDREKEREREKEKERDRDRDYRSSRDRDRGRDYDRRDRDRDRDRDRERERERDRYRERDRDRDSRRGRERERDRDDDDRRKERSRSRERRRY